MNFRISHFLIIILLAVTTFAGWKSYHYLFDKHSPQVSLAGIESNAFYSDDIHCVLNAQDTYKIADISVWLDGKLLINKFKINASSCEHPFFISTRTLTNGVHTLKAEVINGTYNQSKTVQEVTFCVDNTPLQAALIRPENDYKVLQGRTLHIQFQINKEIKSAKVHALSNSYPAFQEAKNSPIYECFIPIACEEIPNEYLLTVDINDHVGNTLALEAKFQIVAFQFKKQNLQIDPAKVQEEKEAGIAAVQLEADIEKLITQSPQQKLWQGIFYPPIDIKAVSTEYGTIRTTQERGRYAHKAVDVLNTPKSVVWATQDGIIILKDRYGHSGNTVVIDHGYGILSLFYHLDSFAEIKVGDKIKRGNPIGTLGKTGYASGYHLHWEMRINNIPVDPMQWIKPNFIKA
jgi:murein DD-endopeptidase MepM/ murein hydrolase activator NlpD